MERLRKAGRISGYQMRMALGNKRMRMIILILLLFVVQTLLPVRSFCGDIHVAAAPVAFVFLVNDYICQFLIIAGAVMLFSDAPFENEGYLYMLPRAGRTSWGLGQIFYIFRIAFLYVGCLMAATILPLVGYLSIQEGWGKIWGTLAKTDASLVYGLEFSVPEMIVSRYTPVEALTVSFLLELACIIWIGLFVYAGNKISRKPLGTVAGVFFTLLDICISNDWLEDAYACSPVSLAQLTTYSGYALKYHIDLRYGVCFFITGIAVLSGLCIILNKRERKGKYLASIKRKIDDETIRSYMNLVGLNPDDKKRVGKYSLGMRQRLGIAQALMEDPDIIILDEPMNALDYDGVDEMRRVFLRLKEQGKLIIIASHIREDVEILCDEVYEMKAGSVKI